jgi:predicted homoserine dehydrogenase-like protein
VGLIGAGKFGAMYLAQAKHTAGIHIVGIADLAPDRARAALSRTGWAPQRFAARSFAAAGTSNATHVTDDARSLIAAPEVDIVIEATGDPAAGIRHALASFAHGKHVVMVNVEADALAGPLLARRAHAAGVVYSLAYGDQPALICEMVDWCRAAGFAVVAAGKGTKYLPEYHASTPDTVWPYYGFPPERVAGRRFQRPHVQFVPRRHQERDRNGRGGERDRIDAGAGGASPFRRAASTICRACCARRRKAGSCTTRGKWR